MKKLMVRMSAVLSAMVVLLLLNTIPSRAETRNATVDLSDTVKNVTFTVTMETAGDYDAILIDPQGSTYTYVATSKTTLVCNLDKAVAGDWVTQVSANGEVPKYHVSVSAKKDSSTEVVKDSIEIGRDIVGLKLYFCDNTLCVEWADDACGNVNLRVTNLNNGELLANQTVEGQGFYLDLPAGVSDISVGVVPSTSRNIEGAEQVFALTIPETPNVTVTFPEESAVNTVSVPVVVSTDGDYSFLVYVNQQLAYESELCGAGEYTVEVPLVTEGENVIEFYVVDVLGNMFSYDKNITLDTVAPVLSLDEVYDNIMVTEDSFTIGGKVVNFDSLYVGEEKVVVASDGRFSYDLILHTGENDITVRATDLAGNETVYDMAITYSEKTGKINVFKVVVVAGGVLLMIVLLVVGTRKKKKGAILAEKKETAPKTKQKKTPAPKPKAEKREKKQRREKKEELPKTRPAGKKRAVILQGIETIVFIVAFYVLFKYVVCIGQAVSGSMEPTIMTNGRFVVNKVAYVSREPQAGEIIMFYNPDAGQTFIKRIVGVAGDEIEFHDGYVYVNGEQLDESAYLGEDVETNAIGKFTVPEGKFFVLGDNRENSNDSRFWENPYVDMENISGKIIFIF